VPSESRLRFEEDATRTTTCRLPPGTLFLVSVLGESGDPSHLPALRACILEVEVVLPDMLRHVLDVDAVLAWLAVLARSQPADAASPEAVESMSTLRGGIPVEGVQVLLEGGQIDADMESTSVHATGESRVI
jgi:hypothetical protein